MSSHPRRQQANASELVAPTSEGAMASPGSRSSAVGGQRPEVGRPGVADGAESEQDEEGAPPAPWHFKVLLVGTAGYLIYRLIWFVFWLTGHAWHG